MSMPETIREDLKGLALPFEPEEEAPKDDAPSIEAWITKQIGAIVHLKKAIAHLEATRQSLIDDINQQYDHLQQQKQDSIDFLEGKLAPVVRHATEGQKRKSVKGKLFKCFCSH